MTRVIHTAQALVDQVVEVDALPARGQNQMAHTFHRYAASAVTILLAARRSGADCVHAGSLGTGPNGDLIRQVLADEGIAASAPTVAGLDTGICFVMVEPSAERTFVTTRGAERHISVESLQTSHPEPGDLVCVSGYSLLPPTCEPLLTWLDTLSPQIVLVLDPGAVFADLDAEVVDRVLARTNVWTSNAEEAAALTGVEDFKAAAPIVAQRLSPGSIVVVRDGPRGCVVTEGGHTAYVPGFPQQPVDTNGAGDTHTGVLCAARVQGLDWLTGARRANAAGAIKVTRKGPDTAPDAAQIDAFLAAHDAAS